MPRITKKERLTAMYKAILTLETVEECKQFFEDLCSPAELTAMEQRYAAASLLLQNRVYQDIQNATNASTSTISRIKRVVTDGSGVLAEAIRKVDAEAASAGEETE